MRTAPEELHLKAVKLVERVRGIPISLVAASLGREVRPFIAEVTGLSQARISQGNLDRLRTSTVAKMSEHAAEWAAEQGSRNGLPAEELKRRRSNIPSCSDGETGSFSSWVHGYQDEAVSLPRTVSAAMEVDELLLTMSTYATVNNLSGFVQALQEFQGRSLLHVPGASLTDETPIADWKSALTFTDTALLGVLWSLYAHLDAEWGSQYFKFMEPVPVFLLVAPLLNLPLGDKPTVGRSRNLVDRPVRRLLELSHALAYRTFRTTWPSEPVGRSDLGKILLEASEHVGNYFDGTRKLTTKVYQQYWHLLCNEYSHKRLSHDELPPSPMVAASVALGWQKLLLNTTNEKKLLSFVVPDVGSYRTHWNHYRQTLGVEQAAHTEQWPEWLLRGSYVRAGSA